MTKLPHGREPPPSGQKIPGSVTKVNLTTGEEIAESMSWQMLAPAAHKCQVCAAEHDPLTAHNAQSLYYQMAFNALVGRWPTWADAVAHCEPEHARQWKEALIEKNAWTEPPDGIAPVRHLEGTKS